jgi:uncharacterized protein DUF6069
VLEERELMTSSAARHVPVIAVAVLAAFIVWGISQLAGVELTLKDDAPSDEVGLVDVLATAAIAGLGAWAVHAALVRLNLTGIWPFIGSTALAISMIGPTWLADGESAVALIAMHLAVGFTLIAGFSVTTARSQMQDEGQEARSSRRPGYPNREWG